MATPGQKTGSCGHFMASFDSHSKCARCRDRGQGDDLCVKGLQCDICSSFSAEQRAQLAVPAYQVKKAKRTPTDGVDYAEFADAQPDENSSSAHMDESSVVPGQQEVVLQDVMAELKALKTKNMKMEAMFLANKVVAPVSKAPATIGARPFFNNSGSLFDTDRLVEATDRPSYDEDLYAADRPADHQDRSVGHPGLVHRPRYQVVVAPEDEFLSDSGDFESQDNQDIGEEPSYRENIRAVRHYMGWTDIPEFQASPQQENNPWISPKPVTSGRINLQLPVDEWLAKRMDSLNLAVAQGYPSKASDSAGLTTNRFLKNPTSRWYDMWADPSKVAEDKATIWSNKFSRLNRTFSRISKASFASKHPSSLPIAQENLRRWEEKARQGTFLCNQAAGLSRCLRKVQEEVCAKVAALCDHGSSGMDSSCVEIVEALNNSVRFQQGVSASLYRTLSDMNESTFVDLANYTLLRRDAYLQHLRYGIKPDTILAMRVAPVHLDTLFPEELVRRAEKELNDFEARRPPPKDRPGHPYKSPASTQPQAQAQAKPSGYQRHQKSSSAARPPTQSGSFHTSRQSGASNVCFQKSAKRQKSKK